jgi:hypothetical protein
MGIFNYNPANRDSYGGGGSNNGDNSGELTPDKPHPIHPEKPEKPGVFGMFGKKDNNLNTDKE